MEGWMTELFRLSAAASWTALAVLVVRLLLKRAPKIYSYLLWLLVFLRAALPVSFSSVFSVQGLGQLGRAALFRIGTMGMRSGGTPDAAGQAVGLAQIAAALSTETGAGSLPLGRAQGLAKTAADGEGIFFLLGVLWLTGVCLFLLGSLYSFWKLKRTVAFAVRAEEGVYETDRIKTAFVLGIFRPRIYLPKGLSSSDIRLILEHERAHIRRHDHQIKAASWLILLLHWFNPLLWVSFWLMGRDMEISCDESVLKNLDGQGRADYGDALLALAAPARGLKGTPLAFGENDVCIRIQNALRYRKAKGSVTAAAVLLVALTAVGCMSDPVQASSERDGARLTMDDAQLAFAREFASAAVNRDADTVYAMLCPKLQERAEEFGIFMQDGVYVMGFSSPFAGEDLEVSYMPEDSIQEYRIEYRVTALTSSPELYMWKGWLTLEPDGETYQVTNWLSRMYTEVAAVDDCINAYGQGIWDFTAYDLGGQTAGEWLQQRLEEGADPDYYGGFTDPGYALEKCLHLEGGEVKETAPQKEQGRIRITYGWEYGEAVFEMAQVKEDGVWIPVRLLEISSDRQ